MKGPGLLSCWDDLVSWQQEAARKFTFVRLSPAFDLILIPMESSVPQLHAGGEPNAHLPMGPVSRAPTGNVQHAGDAANLIN